MKKQHPLPRNITALDLRANLEKLLNLDLTGIANFSFEEDRVAGRNIENLIGGTSIPLGVAGPVAIKEGTKLNHHFIPLATTEGALVASVSRGCKAIELSGGADVVVELVGTTRGPVFKTKNLQESVKLKNWIQQNLNSLQKTVSKTPHLKLLKIDSQILGRNVYCRFYFDCGDAMGMNMVTFASDELAEIIEQKTKAECLAVAGNFDIDKKAAWLNFISGRGKKAWAEVVIEKQIVKDVLKTTPEKIAEVVYRKCQLGSIMSGSIGFNSHYANIIAAIFIATGQDAAHVVEGSLGVTTAEVLPSGDLYFAIYQPALMTGTVGGGTGLPSQKAALQLMEVGATGDVLKFTKIVSAAVMAGELSLLASLAEGSLSRAHKIHGRNEKV